MTYLLICPVALLASLLTFFTGFGLGTLLLPSFAAFFPVEVAVALTAVVHLANGLFKLALVGRRADLGVVVRFGLPAVLAGFAGALVLSWVADLAPLTRYTLAGRGFEVTPVGLAMGLLMLAFASLDLWPGFKRVSLPARYLPLGGLVTGFMGGLSGHQGALRSVFLLRAGLDKAAFIATGVVVGALVDVARLSVYSKRFLAGDLAEEGALLGAAALAAFAGALAGNRLLEKVTLRALELGVTVLLVLVALGLGSGIL